MPATRALRRTKVVVAGPRSTTTMSPSPSMAPNSSTSVPEKPVVMAMR